MARELLNRKVSTLNRLASEIITGIVRRTQAGKDVKNQAFKRYSKAYAKAKKKRFGSSKVNLTAMQSMLNNITSVRIKNGVRLVFFSAFESEKAAINQKTRKFFGTDRKQRKDIKKKLKKK